MLAWEFSAPPWRRVPAGTEVAWHAPDDGAVITVCDVLEAPHAARYIETIALPCLMLVVPVEPLVSQHGVRGLLCTTRMGEIDREVALLGDGDAVLLARLDLRRGAPHRAAWRALLASVRAGARAHVAPAHWVE